MKYRRYLSVVLAIFFIVTVIRAASAKEEKDFYEDCIKNFNFEKVDLSTPEMLKYTHHLNEYFACRVAANDDINECSNMLEPNECTRILTLNWLFYGKLAVRGKASAASLDICASTTDIKKGALEFCGILSDAIAKNDASICSKTKDPKLQRYCTALASSNPAFCDDNECRDKAFFLDALRKGNIKLCDRITSSSTRLKWICKGGVSENPKVCEQNEGIEKFKKDYCTQVAKGNQRFQEAMNKIQKEEGAIK